jgi:hypothetical protein
LGSYGQTVAAPDSARPGNVIFGGSLRTRLYGWDWFEPSSGDNRYDFSGSILRLGISQKRNSWNWDAEFALPVLLGLPPNAIGTGSQQGALGFGGNYFTANSGSQNAVMIFPKQLYFRLNRLGGSAAHQLEIGRFEFLDGSEVTPKNPTLAALRRDRVNARLLGNFSFTDVGRSVDGILYTHAGKEDTLAFTAAVPTRGVYQVDGWGWNRIAFGYGSYTHESNRGGHSADTRIFVIEYDDGRHVLKADNRPLSVRQDDLNNTRINTFGGHTLHACNTTAGTFDVLVWGAAQTGRWGVQQHRAGALDVEVGIQPRLMPRLNPWLRGGYYWGSGDGNPNDKTHGAFFQILPTPRPFARFPFFNMMNNEDAFGTLILRPHPKVTVSTEFHSLRLSNAADLWYSGGGAFQPWTFGFTGRNASGRKSLGNLYDISADYRVNSRFTLTAYVGYAQGLAALTAIYPKDKDGRLGYLEAFIRF